MRTLQMITAVLALSGFAGAQTVTPTSDNLNNDQVNSGAKTAKVTQTVNLKLPEATALHLDTANLVFDISQIGSQDTNWYCAYGLDADKDGLTQDVVSNTSPDFWSQKQVLPLGTSYTPKGDKFGDITINAGKKVTAYPPVTQLAAGGGEVDNADKAYFVCYRTFILQKFSNLGNFKLSVARDTPTGNRGKQLMYIQDNPCSTWGEPTGLYNLPVGASRELIPMRLTTGTTGSRAATPAANNKCRSLTSWLDDLVVVAVVVDGDLSGDNVATLTYTLDSSAAAFVMADSDATPFGNP